jgi:hypothetical protein
MTFTNIRRGGLVALILSVALALSATALGPTGEELRLACQSGTSCGG